MPPTATEEQKLMPAQAATATNGRQEAARLYQELEDRMLARDQEGGSRIYYELLRRGRPLPEIMAYRGLLDLVEETVHRKEVLAQLVCAGMIDVQDRMLYNRSYTTGHKAYRARSVVEIGNAIGWENAHDTIYAGALDIAVGPRWHSVYEMACNVITIFIEGKEVHAVPQSGTSERALLANA